MSEARIVSEILDSPAIKERSIHSGGFDPRTAVFRAREAYRERARARESAARLSAGAEAIGARLQVNGAEATSGDAERRSAAAEAAQAISDDAVAATQQPSFKAVRADVPQQYDEALPLAGSANGVASEAIETSGADSAISSKVDDRRSAVERFATADQEPTLSLTRLDELDERNLPEWFRTDLPRNCRTCRDFRPSADGGRGWCANAWAFTHRRLVQEEDLAPCDSSIGDWWAPVDDVWLVAADVSSHGRTTPLLDRLLAPQTERRRRS